MPVNRASQPNTSVLPTGETDLQERRLARIAERAFEIYQARGSESGQDLADWLQAEREIDAEIEKDDAIGGPDGDE